MSNVDLKKRVEALIKEDKTEKCLQLIADHIKPYQLSDLVSISLLKSRYQRIKKNYAVGTISQENYDTNKNQINKALLSFVFHRNRRWNFINTISGIGLTAALLVGMYTFIFSAPQGLILGKPRVLPEQIEIPAYFFGELAPQYRIHYDIPVAKREHFMLTNLLLRIGYPSNAKPLYASFERNLDPAELERIKFEHDVIVEFPKERKGFTFIIPIKETDPEYFDIRSNMSVREGSREGSVVPSYYLKWSNYIYTPFFQRTLFIILFICLLTLFLNSLRIIYNKITL